MNKSVEDMPWWEREKLLTETDRQAILRAVNVGWAEIDPNWAETEAGRYELELIIRRKYHTEEFLAGMI